MKELSRDCLPIPRLERVNYFYGQMLGVNEFRSEQGYFHAKQRLHNRYLHGYGVVCGLEVVPCGPDEDPCAPRVVTPPVVTAPPPGTTTPAGATPQTPVTTIERKPGGSTKPCVQIECGLALTCDGDEIVVRAPVRVDLLGALDAEMRKQLDAGKVTVAIAICYRASPIDPVRPIQLDGCTNMVGDCVPSRLRDDFCVKVVPVKADAPLHDCACSPCTNGCVDPCLVLATVVITPDQPIQIDNTVRRTIAPFETTRIVGINWVHGATYTRDAANKLLDGGLKIAFSGPVYAETLQRGVIDLWGVEGGKGRSGEIYNIGGQYVFDVPPSDLVSSVIYKRNTDEYVNYGDRVLITFRSAFVLDRCCRAVDGFHIGGMAPQLAPGPHDPPLQPTVSVPPHHECNDPASRGFQPWRSGNGTPGGTFESWIWVEQETKS